MRGKQRLGPYRAICLANLVGHSSAFKTSRPVGFRHRLGLLYGAVRHRIDDAPAYSGGEHDAVIVVALMFVLLLVSSFCLEMRDQDTKRLFAELHGEPVSAPADYRSLEERCEEVGKQHKLTPRELEIMQLLCKGRTKAYIAETLYLTENTVKGHTKHIYSKLDVHSKQELLELVER